MKQRYLPGYIHLLVHARATGDSEYPTELAFNGYTSVDDYRLMLLHVETRIWKEIYLLMRLIRQESRVRLLAEQWNADLEQMLAIHHPRLRHTFLSVLWDGREIPPDSLPRRALEKLDDYLQVQRNSYLKHRKVLLGDRTIAISDYTLEGIKPMEVAEILCLLLYTGMVTCHGSHRREDLIRYCCSMWNIPVPRHINEMMRQVMQRENPAAFLDRLKQRLQEYIHQKEVI